MLRLGAITKAYRRISLHIQINIPDSGHLFSICKKNVPICLYYGAQRQSASWSRVDIGVFRKKSLILTYFTLGHHKLRHMKHFITHRNLNTRIRPFIFHGAQRQSAYPTKKKKKNSETVNSLGHHLHLIQQIPSRVMMIIIIKLSK